MLLLFLLVVGMIIVLLVKPKKHGSSEPMPPSSPPSQPDSQPRAFEITYRRSRSSSLTRVARNKWADPDIYR